ncbi:MAG: hypothetical protein GY866_35925 [Proteobacteria bacterium]|nr:hypothetical protein [Pseudomonadota bacterium]
MKLKKLKDWTVFSKTIALSVVSVLPLLLVFLIYLSPLFKEKIFEERRNSLKNPVDTAFSILKSYEAQVQSGNMSLAEARKNAIWSIQNLRYEGDQYFWINDMHPKMVLHPIKPELNGKDVSDNKDPDGKRIFVEFVKVCRSQGEGFVDYMWPKPGFDEPVPKISFVKLFQPWGWIVGSGIYIDDVQAEIAAVQTRIIVVILVAFLIAILLGWFLARNISRLLTNLVYNLTNSSDQLTSASQQIAESSLQLSEGATEQAASLEETSSSMEQISSQIKENADNASSVASSMEGVANMVKQSSENAKTAAGLSEDARSSAEGGVNAMGTITAAMKEIREGSDKITDIIEVINEITHQTKMLATNAAIEAARAGDQGKGFAVVADEVSKLAENSKSAAKEIGQLIKDSARKAEKGNELAEKGEDVLKEILEKSIKVADLVNEVSTSAVEEARQVDEVERLVENIKNASSEQANGVDQVTRAMVEMDKVTQSNAANSEEAASASEELSAQAQMLQGMVLEISIQVGLKGKKGASEGDVGEQPWTIASSGGISNLHERSHTPKAEPRSTGTHTSLPVPRPTTPDVSVAGKRIKPSEVIPMRDDFKEF